MAIASKHSKPVVIDPKGRDHSKYRGATIIVPNQQEAGQAVNREIADEVALKEVGEALLNQLGCEAVLITQGEKGMTLFERAGNTTSLWAVSRQVYDVTGAGDTVAGSFTLALTTGAGLVDCASIANYAAGIVVGKIGTSTVTIDELMRAVSEGV